LEDKLQFARDLMTGENFMKSDENTVAAVLKVCKEIREVQGKTRRLIFMSAFFMSELNQS
jgi:hypothetical protein